MRSVKTPALCRRTVRRFCLTVACCLTVLGYCVPGSAAGLQGSTVYQGIMSLLNDLMSAAMILCPVVGAIAAVYFLIRRSMADEQDGKMWNKRVFTAIICGVAGALVTGAIALLTSYFSAPL